MLHRYDYSFLVHI